MPCSLPGVSALSREQALDLLEELADVRGRLERLRADLRKIVDESG